MTLLIDIVAILLILVVGVLGFVAILLSLWDDIKAKYKRKKMGAVRSEEFRSPESW